MPLVTTELIRAALVGVCAAAPVGPVLLLVIQKTLSRGRLAGMLTGLGAAVGDSAFATVGLLALSLAGDLLSRHQAVLMLAGGLLLALVGLSMYNSHVRVAAEGGGSDMFLWSCPFQSMATTLSNPGAIALVTSLLGIMHLGSGTTVTPVPLLVAAVFAGELTYWVLMVSALSSFVRLREKTLVRAGRIAGIVVWGFAVVLLVKGALLFFRNVN